MTFRGNMLSSLGALLLLNAPMAASAKPVTSDRNADAKVVVLKPLKLTLLQSLDFGTLTQTSAGTAVLNPNSDTLSLTGGVKSLGNSHCAEFGGAASRLSLVFIQIPTTTIVLKRVGGNEKMNVTNWTLQGSAIRLVTGAFDFKVGATLTMPQNQAEGTYVGSFDVTVQYY